MRLAHYCEGLWDPGGISTYVRRLSEAQRAAGHEVFFLDTRPGSRPDPVTGEAPQVVVGDSGLFDRAKALRLDVLHLHSPVASLPPGRVTTVRSLHGHSPYCPSGSRYLRRRGTPCDRPYSLLGCLWGHVADRCGSIRPHNTWEGFRRTWAEREVLPAILTITASAFLKEQMVRNGYPERMIEVLRVPPPESLQPSPVPQGGIPRFVYLGRVESNKGVDCLIRAVAEVREPARFDVVGDGTKLAGLRDLAAHLGVADRVTFHGWVGPDVVLGLLRGCRALILPSVWHEPGATVAVEALAAGRPLIMSRVGGMPEVVPGERTGLLVEPNDVAGLARAVERLARDGLLAARMGEQGRHLVEEQYTLPKHLAALTALYERALACSAGEGPD